MRATRQKMEKLSRDAETMRRREHTRMISSSTKTEIEVVEFLLLLLLLVVVVAEVG